MKNKIGIGLLLCLILLMGLGVAAQAQPELPFENGRILASQMENMAKDDAVAVKPVRSLKLSTSRISVTQGKIFTVTMTVSPSFASEAQCLALLGDISVIADENKLEPLEAVIKTGNKVALKFRAKGAPGTTTLKFRANSKKITRSVKVTIKPVQATKVTLNQSKATLYHDEKLQLSASVLPENTSNKAVKWTSSNKSVASVSSSGQVTAKKAGTVTIIAKTSNGKKASCKITVKTRPIYPTSISLSKTQLNLKVGKTYTLKPRFAPANTNKKTVKWTTSDKSVATVDKNGKVKAKGSGSAFITATTSNGQTARCTIQVTRKGVAYRALLIGNSGYAGVNYLNGPQNDVGAMRAMMSAQKYSGERFRKIEAKQDLTGDQIRAAIKSLYNSGIQSSDVTFFYFSGHGYSQNGTPYIMGLDADTSAAGAISVHELRSLLDPIPGKVVVILDSCYSGGFIGKGQSASGYNEGVISAFEGNAKANLATGKYTVLTACRGNQLSYSPALQISPNNIKYYGMATALIVESAGYNCLNNTAVNQYADTNKDKKVTVNECVKYVHKNVDLINSSLSGDNRMDQDMQYYTQSGSTVLFAKTSK